MKMRIIIALGLLVLVGSCAKKKAEKQEKEDQEIITQYIADNNLSATLSSTGLHYVIDSVGTGEGCNAFSTVRVAYKGYLSDGTVFDESDSDGITFGLQSVIFGWTEGITYYKEGGSGVLLIPSALGYGSQKKGSIPKNSVLIFDIHLLEVVG